MNRNNNSSDKRYYQMEDFILGMGRGRGKTRESMKSEDYLVFV